jgi:Flp pilus assembly protein TadD/predicted aspartyl protease
MSSSVRTLILGAAVLVAFVLISPVITAVTPEAAQVQLQVGNLLLADGRYPEAFDVFEQVKTSEDPRARRQALTGAVTAALRLADFSHAHDDAELLAKIAGRDAAAIALYADALWAIGFFEESERKFDEALALQPRLSRAMHGRARSLVARGRLNEALTVIQGALGLAPRDAELHHTLGNVYEQLRRYEEAANAFSSYINLLPNKDRSSKAAWARAEVRFLRAFGNRPPLQLDPGSAGKLHTIPFRLVNDKVIVKARINRSLMDFVLDTGSEQTVITRRTSARLGIRPITYTLSAGIGDIGVRQLELTRIDELEIGTLRVRNVPAVIKNPPLRDMPTEETESFSPLSLGLSVIVDYDKLQLLIGQQLPPENVEKTAIELPLRVHRLAMIPGHVDGDPASFILDTGGQVISISADKASTLDKPDSRHIPLKVYGASGWDKTAFLMPGVDLAFQTIQYRNYPVVVLNLRAPSILLGIRLGGIVGHKFLSNYRVTIDLNDSVVRLTPRPGMRPNPTAN